MFMTLFIPWREDVLAQKLQQRSPLAFSTNQSRDYEIGVAVLPLGSRIKIERLARPLVENLVRGDGCSMKGGRSLCASNPGSQMYARAVREL